MPEDQFLIYEIIKKSTFNPDLSTGTEYRIQRKVGEIRWVREFLQKFSAESRTPGQFQGFVHDITGRKRAEETLQK